MWLAMLLATDTAAGLGFDTPKKRDAIGAPLA